MEEVKTINISEYELDAITALRRVQLMCDTQFSNICLGLGISKEYLYHNFSKNNFISSFNQSKEK